MAIYREETFPKILESSSRLLIALGIPPAVVVLRYLPGPIGLIRNVMGEKRRLFLLLTGGLMAASLLTNVAILSVVTGSLPTAFLVNNGSFALQADLDDPLDRFLEQVFPYYNYPFALIMFPRHFLISDEFGFKQDVLLAQPLFLNIHYFADFAPFALLISAYMVLTRYYFSVSKAGIGGRVGGRRSGVAAGTGALAAPSASSGASTALTALAAGVCCGGFAVESSIYILGLTI
ncbi:MAG: hypothetical protein HYW93_03755, partial [Thaumarchaeota archaeon]|nr:hypothetical protein [Nitrososphaerota archaeon]